MVDCELVKGKGCQAVGFFAILRKMTMIVLSLQPFDTAAFFGGMTLIVEVGKKLARVLSPRNLDNY